jgi:Tol biopolymer transport system component
MGPAKALPVTRIGLTVVLVSIVASCSSPGSSASRSKTVAASAHSVSSTAPSPPTIAATDLQGKILFTRAGGKYGDETIFTANADGTDEQRISGFGSAPSEPFTQCCPRWAPDGKHILWAASAPDGRVATGIADPDGSHLHTLPLPPGSLNLDCSQALSLTTDRLACGGWSETKPRLNGLYTIRASDGGRVNQVLPCSQDCRVFDFSPDGSRIFFFRAVKRFPSIGDPLGSLFVMIVDGTDLHQITPADMPVEVAGNSGGRLSPDGRQIVFTSAGAIWTVRADGTALRKVFEDAQGRLAITPTWSPNGRFILFGLDPPDVLATVDAAPPNSLYVIKVDGTDLTPVVVSKDWKRNPDWVAAD